MRVFNLPLLFIASLVPTVLSDAAASETKPKAVSTDLPRVLRKVNAVVLNNNLAVLDGDWESGEISATSLLAISKQIC